MDRVAFLRPRQSIGCEIPVLDPCVARPQGQAETPLALAESSVGLDQFGRAVGHAGIQFIVQLAPNAISIVGSHG